MLYFHFANFKCMSQFGENATIKEDFLLLLDVRMCGRVLKSHVSAAYHAAAL